MKKSYLILFFILMAVSVHCALWANDDIVLPHGFVTYSRGETYERVLCRAEIAPGMTFEQIHATERPIVEKGEYGGDITGQISFDGKWIAFARSLSERDNGSGGNDYANFKNWDIYIARVDGDLPVKPIRIAHGYFPSWGDDSFKGDEKTLYFAVHETPAVHKVRINGKGEIIEAESEVALIPQDGYEGFVFTAPNGQFAAYRKSGAVYTYWFEGPNKGKSILMTGGCHPHVTANSQWVYHANRNAVRADGSARGEAGAGGLYHYGSSNDMNWFVTRTEGDNTIINKGRESWLCTLYATDTRFDTEKAVKLSDMAGFIDVHVYNDKQSKKAAKANRERHERLLSHGYVAKTNLHSYAPLSKDTLSMLSVNKKAELFRWDNNTADSRIIDLKGNFLRSCHAVPDGLAFLGKNGRMHLSGGSFKVEDPETAQAVTQAVRLCNRFSMEMQFISFSDKVSGPARIASSSKDWSLRNWTIGQENNKLVLRLRTTDNGTNGTNTTIELGEIELYKPYHLILSYVPGYLSWALNGEMGQSISLKGDLSNWEDLSMIFGNEFSGERSWYGEIQGIRCYACAFSPKEMKKHYREAQKTLEQLKPEKEIKVEAVVVENSSEPTIEQLKGQGYTRCLTTRQMRVTVSDEPLLPVGSEFVLKEWTILGLQPINKRQEGSVYTLYLYDANAHPELDNEYTVEGLSVFNLPIYYNHDVR